MTLNLRNPQVEEIWLSALRAAGRKPATLSIYRYAVEQLLEWRQGDPDLTTVTRVEALAFVRHLTDTFKPSGVLCRVKALRAFYSWAVAEEMATTNPFTRITISVPEDPQPTASEDQIEAMLARAKRSARDLALITLLVDSGARKGEVAGLQMGDVDTNSGTIAFTTSKSRPRTIPLSDRAVVAIGRWLRRRGVGRGSVWSVQDPYGLVRQAVKRHSNATVSPHTLRRAFAVRRRPHGLRERRGPSSRTTTGDGADRRTE